MSTQFRSPRDWSLPSPSSLSTHHAFLLRFFYRKSRVPSLLFSLRSRAIRFVALLGFFAVLRHAVPSTGPTAGCRRSAKICLFSTTFPQGIHEWACLNVVRLFLRTPCVVPEVERSYVRFEHGAGLGFLDALSLTIPPLPLSSLGGTVPSLTSPSLTAPQPFPLRRHFTRSQL